DVDGVAEVVEADPCRSVVALREGRIAVHARDLGGGELVVRTARADVRVIGTIFEVDVQRSLEVRVSEGIVAVNVTDGPRVRLERNERFSLEDGVQPWDGAPFETAVRAWSEGGPVAEPAAPNEGAAGDGPQSDLDGELGPDGREPTDDSEAVPSDSAPSVHAELGEPSTEQASERASPSQPRLSVDELFTAAESARRNGDLAEARRFYRLAGQRRGTTAESAWIRLARLELQAGSPSAALRALQRRRGSVFVAEASWLKVQALEAAGRLAEARRVADRLVRRRGSTPQGRAAAAWLDSH
ncbi:MAG: tetratricopeptide repeat protein, partial [Myxococcota bacterium]